MAPVTVQVASPALSAVEAQVGLVGPPSVQVTEPVGVTPEPLTVALKVKSPPVSTPEAESLTTTWLVASPIVAVLVAEALAS